LALMPGEASSQETKAGGSSPPAPNCEALCLSIAKEIEGLKSEHPQLAQFSADQAVSGCSISYDHKTHRPTHRGGWTAAFPAPDPDGIAFYIHLYDRPEQAGQADTQPVMPPWRFGKYKVTILLLEGDKVPPVSGRIHNRMHLLGMGIEGRSDKDLAVTGRKDLEASLGKEVLVWGTAADAKMGAVIRVPDSMPVYVPTFEAWPKELAGQPVLALGVLSRANLPQAQRAGPGQEASQGVEIQPFLLSKVRYRAAK